MQITRKIMPYMLAGAGILGAAGIYANKQAEIRQQEKREAEFQHRVDSIKKADGLDDNGAINRIVNMDFEKRFKDMLNDMAKQRYNEACERYNLDPKLSQTEKQIGELKVLEGKMDSIKRENFMHSILESMQ